ncbi:MAG: hypothetical protein WAV09_02975 [Minisyncoccia bacterium]
MNLFTALDWLAVIVMLWNVVFIVTHYRHRFWALIKPSEQFAAQEKFLESVHDLAHEHGLEVAGVVVNPRAQSSLTFSVGNLSCEADTEERAKVFEDSIVLMINSARKQRMKAAANGE